MTINTNLLTPLKVKPSPAFMEWVNYQDSLTDKLKDLTGEVQLELKSQQWCDTDCWSKNILKISDELVFQREIIMSSHQIPYWYAKSIIPQQCYNVAPEFFDRLKTESIKKLIFNEERVTRTQMFNYAINKQCMEFYWVKKYIEQTEEILWVRIAQFCFQHTESFYLIEIMLPKLGELSL